MFQLLHAGKLRMPCRRSRWLARACAVTILLSPALPTTHSAEAESVVTVDVDVGRVVGASRINPGLTHTRYSADSWNEPAAKARAEGALSRRRRLQNQHLMGWGTLNPEPSPGVYDWRSLDERLDLIRRTGGIPVITLCCAPDWMKGGAPGETDWSKLEVAPRREHFADFAELARQTALRYPDVHHYQVWNEFKGFYRADENRWDYEGYVELYNLVYEALKSVNPSLKVGGPYVVVDSWSAGGSHPSDLRGSWGTADQRALDVIEYWLRHRRGADFITVDLTTETKDRGHVTDEYTAAEKLSAVAAWVRQRTTLPLWFGEWYVLPSGATDWHLQRQAAVLTTALAEMTRSGTEVALTWGPQAEGSTCRGCLWTDTRDPSGGAPTPALNSFDALASQLEPGTDIVWSTSSSDDLTVLSSRERTLLVNHRADPMRVDLNGVALTLNPYEIRTVTNPPMQDSHRGRRTSSGTT